MIDTAAAAEPRWRDLTAAGLRLPTFVLGTGVLMHSMNSLLMSTVMPSAVTEIGGLEYMSWPTTSFLAASVIAACSGATVRAMAGARTGYVLAALLFGVGSLVSGMAPEIGYLVAGRFVQGAGGGLLSALAYVMVRNVYPKALWPRVFALFSSVWGISVLAGPFTGGIFASLGIWRGAFVLVFVMALLLAMLAARALPQDQRAADIPAFPGLRLALASLAIVFLSLAAPTANVPLQAAFIFSGLGTMALALMLDRRMKVPLLPSDAFSTRTTVGLGIWVLFLITAANDPLAIYGPLFLQTLHDMSPLFAGYLVAMESMAWTLAAAIVASLPNRLAPVWLVSGPVVMGVGLAGISAVLPIGDIGLLFVFIVLAGAGIGACFSFLSQAILGHAREGEGDAAASSVPTIQLIGLAVGAAFAGLVANLTGLSAGLSVATVTSASAWVPGVFAVPSVIAGLAAVHLVRLLTPEGAAPRHPDKGSVPYAARKERTT